MIFYSDMHGFFEDNDESLIFIFASRNNSLIESPLNIIEDKNDADDLENHFEVMDDDILDVWFEAHNSKTFVFSHSDYRPAYVVAMRVVIDRLDDTVDD